MKGGGGRGGLSSVAAIYGSLFQQKVQREQSKKKPAFYALRFQYLNPQQVISNIAVPSSLRQWNVELCMLYKSPLRRTLYVTQK